MGQTGRFAALILAALLAACAHSGAPAPEPVKPIDTAALKARADALLDEVGKSLSAGRTAEAEAALAEALPLYRQGKDRQGEATCLLFQAIARVAAGDKGAATPLLEQTLALTQEAGDRFSGWMVLWMMAELERNQGNADAALARYERGLAVLRELAASPESISLDGLMRWGKIFGAPGVDLDQLKMIAPLAKLILPRFAEAITRDSYGGALVEANRLAEAEAQLTEAFELSRSLGGLFDSPIHAHVGDLRRRQWRFDEARESYRKALAGVGAMPQVPFASDNWMEVQMLGQLAEIELLGGKLDAALAWNDRALEIVRRNGDRKREAAILEDRAGFYLRAGRLHEAGEISEEALKIAQEEKDLYRQAVILNDLGLIAVLQGAYEAAAVHLETAVSLLNGTDNPYMEASTLALLSEAYMLLESRGGTGTTLERLRQVADKARFRPAQALLKALEASERYRSGKGDAGEVRERYEDFWNLPELDAGWIDKAGQKAFLEIVSSDGGMRHDAMPDAELARLADERMIPYFPEIARLALGVQLFRRGEFVAARQEFTKLLDIQSSDFGACASAAIGTTYLREGNVDEAIRFFSRAVDRFDTSTSAFRVDDFVTSMLGSDRRWFSAILVELLAQQGRVEEAFSYAERSRARALLQTLGNRRLKPAHGADGELLAETEALRASMSAWERQALTAPAVQRASISEDVRHARERYEQLMIRIKVSNPEYSSLTTVEPLQRQELQKEIPPDATLISYFVSASKVHAWVLDRTTFRYVALPLTRKDLEQAVCWADEVAGHLRSARSLEDRCKPEEGQSESLYDGLVAPLLPYVRQKRLILVPHAELHYVPFAALRNPKTHRYLVEDYTLTYLPSASVLPFLRRKESPVRGRALVLGDPAQADPDLEPLPEAKKEAEAVARLFGARPLLGSEATEARLHDLKGEVDLLHIAAHGLYDPRNPLFSRIALAPEGDYDGNVEVHEIFSDLDLDGVNLVVLSACRTAVGERSGGDEITGLTRAFLYAGSPGVISTLWSIDDEASALLMEDFYRRLRTGDSAAEALRQAQIRLLRNPKYQDPYYWAAFNLTGDPQGRWGRARRSK